MSAAARHKHLPPQHQQDQPDEMAPGYIFLASEDANYMSGQTLHINGGEILV